MLFSLILVALLFIVLGPLVGTITLLEFFGDLGEVNVFVFMGGYFLGFFPALASGVTYWLALFTFKKYDYKRYYFPSIIISCFTSSMVVLAVFGKNLFQLVTSVCLVATWSCAHIVSKKLWSALENT